jgi:glycosyltransferase involved in cell wall biosynthesis
MHVGFVVYGGLDEQSGGARYDRRFVDCLRDAGDRVTVVDLPWPSYARRFTHNVSLDLYRRLDRPFDVVVQDELCHPSLLAHNRLVERDNPMVSLVHHLRSSEPRSSALNAIYRRVERRYLRSVDAAVCVSPPVRDAVTALHDLPTLVAQPGADHVSPSVTDRDVRERARDGPLRVVFLGNVVPRKGVTTLVDALARLPDDGWSATVVGSTTGDAAYADRVRRRIDDGGLADAVSLTGRLSQPAVADHLARSHVLAVPSEYEGFGMVYLEGMGFGLPAVASDAGGASAVVDDETGFLVPPRDPEAVADALGTLLADRDRLAELGVEARRRYTDHPTWSETASRVRSFLRRVVERDAG